MPRLRPAQRHQTEASSTPALFESLLCAGRSGEVLRRLVAADPRHLDPVTLFAYGRAALEEEDFDRAGSYLERVADVGADQLARRARAHLAYLDYYRGDFERGEERARAARDGATGIALVEASLYLSVNTIALNASRSALESALTAERTAQRIPEPQRSDLRFRILRQLAHVLVARGAYVTAWAIAERAAVIARRTGSDRHLGLAAYLRGYVKSARGEADALLFFSDADRYWGGTHHAFGRWLRFVWATALRDQGDLAGARRLRAASGIRIPWEDAVFDAAENATGVATPVTPRRDEFPFFQATAGYLHALRNEIEQAGTSLRSAALEFERLELHHYRRGAVLTLAASLVKADPREAASLVRAEIAALTSQGIKRWPWWHLTLVRRLARFCIERGLEPAYWRDVMTSFGGKMATRDLLRAHDLSERELEAIALWIENPAWSRTDLAHKMGVREATIRNLLNRGRRKLSVDSRRGPMALRARLGELAAR